jgi:hypothetical protein
MAMTAQPPSDPFEPLSVADLEQRKTAPSPYVQPISRTRLLDLSRILSPKLTPVGTPALELTARHPYDPAGFMDFYKPGRWDCEANLVFMNVIVQTGSLPGQWEGTVGYARFTAPQSGTYLVLANFSGYQITMNLKGPWGTASAYCTETSDAAAASALWTGTAGTTLFFTLTCAGMCLGYLESVRVYPLS